ncbi:hypothetical protein [Zhihengliuella flava]|uniref:Holin n=1 Tax=Zhihengliuella flava TaxID=1285193 RepID=A0A931GG04_9MICC|nr:hypothetical protein [Zhihengliuella flava]MBG6085800.1 hypothetical protein [Zhihengliuella flava]MBG6085878.1 hypothetical protein [Zhihengliuella flava]
METTQQQHPWRAVVRTIFAAVVALAALAPAIFTAITMQSPEVATGAAAGVLAVAGAITRVLALPGVETFLRRYLPFLAAGKETNVLPPTDDEYASSDRH